MFVLRCDLIVCLVLLIGITGARIFDRCDFARTLRYKHKLTLTEINVWACIAQYQSGFNTEAVSYDSDGTGYHGMFQISDRYWCSKSNEQKNACNVLCSQLVDDDLTDDFNCIKNIFGEHQRLSGNGFNAWTSYINTCQYVYEGLFTGDCFVGDVDYNPTSTSTTKATTHRAITPTQNRIYDRCELARELYYVHQLPADQIATWVCIAKHESNYNTSAVGYGDHGLFQISDIYWCSPPGRGWVCGLSCAKLRDSDISDDVVCMKKIYDEHQRLSGNGFNAWSVYRPYCKDRSEQYIDGCFDYSDSNSVDELKLGETSSHEVKTYPDKTKLFERCELAIELHKQHKIPIELVPTYVCIAYHESKYNTSAVGHLNVDGSGDHGIFQISDIYWCSPPPIMGGACGLSCDQLEDSDISNDVECVRKIYDEHQRLSSDGFNAWSVYRPYCKGQSDRFVDGCFDEVSNSIAVLNHRPAVTAPTFLHNKSQSSSKSSSSGKIYERCELARELRHIHDIPMNEIPNWVCIAYHESKYDTSAIGRLNADGSGDHGLFQISDIYWCSLSGRGNGCSVSCSDLEDEDISDDVQCIKQIFDEHSRISGDGDGYTAWSVYLPYCKGMSSQFIDGCFVDNENSINSLNRRPGITSPPVTSKQDLNTNINNKTTMKTMANQTLQTSTTVAPAKVHTTTSSTKHENIPTLLNRFLPQSAITSTTEVSYRSTSTILTERERVKSLFDIYFNGFRTRPPTTLKSLFFTTQRPVNNLVGNITNVNASLQSSFGILGSKNTTTTLSKALDASKKSGVFSSKKGAGFIFGVNVPSESTLKTTTSRIYSSSSGTPTTTTKLPFKLIGRDNRTLNSSTTKFPFYSKNSLETYNMSSSSTFATTTISPFMRQYTPATVNFKITYQSIFSQSQRPSSTTLPSLPAYYSNRLTTTTTNSPSINQIINTHDNSVSMFNSRFTRAPSTSTPNNNFDITSSEHNIQYDRTSTTQSLFDKFFDLFVH